VVLKEYVDMPRGAKTHRINDGTLKNKGDSGLRSQSRMDAGALGTEKDPMAA
jgi:hypothetical protein